MKNPLFPKCSFCIELTDKQGLKMINLLEKKKIPFYYIYDGTYTGGCVSCNCKNPDESEKEIKVVLELSDEGKNWLASNDHLKTSNDGVFVELITPENPDDGKPMPEFSDVFKVFEATDGNLKKWKNGKIDDIKDK